MFPLRILHPNKKHRKIMATPINLIHEFSGLCLGPHPIRSSKKSSSAKGTPPRTFFCRGLRASMTLEASLVLPLFLLFFLTIGSSMEIFRFHSKMEMALWEIGRETCVYGTALEGSSWLSVNDYAHKETGELLEMIGNLALSQTYVKGRVEERLGSEYLEEAPVKGGADGLIYLGGSLINDEDFVRLVVTYAAQPRWTVSGFRTFYLQNYYYGRMWTGFDVTNEENEIYYLAENASVYHRDINCSHLKLQPYQTSNANLATAVNSHGSHYRPCTICARGAMTDQVWISPEGDCYHYTRDCSGLKRTILTVTWKEAKRYRPCSRCGN